MQMGQTVVVEVVGRGGSLREHSLWQRLLH